MKKITILLVLFLASIATNAQTEVGDVTLPNTLTYSEQELVLNGTGIREKLFFDIYSAGLYLQKKTNNSATIINADEATGIRLHITSGLLSRSKMMDALQTGFKKATNGNVSPIATRIDAFVALLPGEVVVGDIYDFVYVKDEGTSVYKAGKHQGSIKGLDFKKALFGIWLCDKPADKGLKEGLLGN